MRIDEWTEAQTQAAPLIARGIAIRRVARHVECHERTIYKWLENPLYKRYVHEIRDRSLEQTLSLLTRYSTDAVKTLHDLLGDPTHAVRLGAARSILDLMIRIRELGSLDSRLAEVEARLEATEEPVSPRPYNRWASPQ